MWLVECETLRLKWFSDAYIPPYAILSHTWGPDGEELTFSDLQEQAGLEKPGYDKLVKCAAESIAHGLQYCWVDTCCIDKTSSAELSEAINSMFAWYRLADICFAYLKDYKEVNLDSKSRAHPDSVPGIDLSPDISSSRWFTRGWTLQELIAPHEVVFYDAEWRPIGTKQTDYSRILTLCTGIESEVLRGERKLDEVPIATRMSWASSRRTTRLEDAAYCLLGIFDVSMPLLYGEGKKAFLRLQEEITKRSGDLSLLAWQSVTEDDESDLFVFHEQSRQSAVTRYLAEHPSEFAHISGRQLSDTYSSMNVGQGIPQGRGLSITIGHLCICPGFLFGLLGLKDEDGNHLAILLKTQQGTLETPEPMRRILDRKVWRLKPSAFKPEDIDMQTILLVDRLRQNQREPVFGLFDFMAQNPAVTSAGTRVLGLERIRAKRPCYSIWSLGDTVKNLLDDTYEQGQYSWHDPIITRFKCENDTYFDVLVEVGLSKHGRVNAELCRCNIIQVSVSSAFPIESIWNMVVQGVPLSSKPSWTYVAPTGLVKLQMERSRYIGEDNISVRLTYEQSNVVYEAGLGSLYSDCSRTQCRCERCQYVDRIIFKHGYLETLRQDTATRFTLFTNRKLEKQREEEEKARQQAKKEAASKSWLQKSWGKSPSGSGVDLSQRSSSAASSGKSGGAST